MVEGERDDATGKFKLFGGSLLERIATEDDLKNRKLFVPMQRVQHSKLVSDNNFAIKKSRLKLNLAFQKNIRQEFGNPEDTKEKELYFDLVPNNPLFNREAATQLGNDFYNNKADFGLFWRSLSLSIWHKQNFS